MFKKLLNWFKKPRKELTVKGYYIYKYCKKIINNEIGEDDRIMSYDEVLDILIKDMYQIYGENFNRKEISLLYIQMIEELNPILCKELVNANIDKI